MAFMKALLQKRRSMRIGAFDNKNSNSRLKTCDETASAASQTSAIETAAQQGKWESYIRQVEASSAEDWGVTNSDDSSHEEADASVSPQAASPLHLALQYRAPLAVLVALLTICEHKLGLQVPEECVDANGQTPLHVAVAAGCEEDIVHRLLGGTNLLMPAVVHDAQARTPLHVACCAPPPVKRKGSFFGANTAAMEVWHKRRAVTVLLEHYPEAACLQDVHGQTPLDYARQAGFSKNTVQELEFAVQLHAPVVDVPGSQLPRVSKAVSIRSMSSLGMDGTEEGIVDWDL